MRARNRRRSKVSWSSDALALADEDLAVQRLGGLHALAEIARIDRHLAPAENLQALVGDRLGDDLLDELRSPPDRAA